MPSIDALSGGAKQRIWTAGWAALAALGVCAIFERMQGVFYAYVLFDLMFSLFLVPSIVSNRRTSDGIFLLITIVWLAAGWFLAGVFTRLLFAQS